MELIGSFTSCGFKINWINAISKVGYVKVEKITPESVDDFAEMWLLSNKVGKFLKECDGIKAEAIAYHSVKTPTNLRNVNVFPRYEGDYEENNDTYNIAESDVQKVTSSKEVIEPLMKKLEEYLNC